MPLRVLTMALLAAVAAYVGVFSAMLAFRVVPAAQSVLENSHTTVAAWTTRASIDATFDSCLVRTRALLQGVAEQRMPSPDDVRSVAALLRGVSDSTWAQDATRALFRVSDDSIHVRTALMADAQAAAAAALVQTANDLERGQWAFAGRDVALADSLRRRLRAVIVGIEYPALRALFDGERTTVAVADSTRVLVIWWCVGGIVLLAAFGYLMHRRFYRPLARLESGLAAVAAGDFTHPLPHGGGDEMGRLAGLFNELLVISAVRLDEQSRRAANAAARLGRVFATSPNEVYVFDADTLRFTQVSRGAQQNLGWSTEELRRETPLTLLPNYTREAFTEALEPLRRGAVERVTLRTTQRRRDGSQYPVALTVHLSRDEEPQVFVAIAEDLSDRLRLEAERDRIFDLSADMLVVARPDGTVLRMNPACARVLGLDPASAIGYSLFDSIHPDDHRAFADAMRRLLDGTPVRGLTVRVQPRGAGLRWVSWNCDPPVGGALYVVGREVSQEKEEEARARALRSAVEQAAREWSQTFDAIDDPIIIVDDALRVVRLNERARRLTAMRYGEVIGRALRELGPDPLWHHARDLAAEARKGSVPLTRQVKNTTDDSSWELSAIPLHVARDGLQAVILVMHDVSSVVQMQEEIQRTEAMATMGTVVAGVAHEVRNPLFSMTATLDAFEARNADKTTHRHVEVLRAQLSRLQGLMQDLLDYGRPPALEVSCVAVEQLLGKAVEATATQAAEMGSRVTLGGEGLTMTVQADRHRLVQVFINLFSNALHFSPKESNVEVTATEVGEDGHRWVEVAVLDHGPGFAPGDLPRIFEPFFTKRKGGTGLGLAIVRRIVEQHGGRVVAERPEGGGGLVRVRLPVTIPWTDGGGA